MSEPGVDLHVWESRWASVEEDADADPAAALSQYLGIVEEVLVARGYDVDDSVASRGEDPEVVETYRSVRETSERADVGEASRADVEAAIADLRELFDALAAERL